MPPRGERLICVRDPHHDINANPILAITVVVVVVRVGVDVVGGLESMWWCSEVVLEADIETEEE